MQPDPNVECPGCRWSVNISTVPVFTRIKVILIGIGEILNPTKKLKTGIHLLKSESISYLQSELKK